MDASEAAKPPAVAPGRELALLYDGDCPLCMREVAFLRRRDRDDAVDWVDIASPDFDAARYGLDQATVMARIHGVLPDGTVIEGMEVFRRVYAAVGLGWVMAPSRWPLFGRLFDAAYRWFARNRLRLTGRPDACTDRCEIPGEAAR